MGRETKATQLVPSAVVDSRMRGGLTETINLPDFSSKSHLRLRAYAGLAALDIIAIAFSFFLGDFVRFGSTFPAQSDLLLGIFLTVYLVLAAHSGAYSMEVLRSPRFGALKALRTLVYSSGILLAALFFMKSSTDFSRAAFGISALTLIIALPGARMIFGHALGKRLKWIFTNDLVLVDGIDYLPEKGEIAVFADAVNLQPDRDDVSAVGRLGTILKDCDRVVVVCSEERRDQWIRMLRGVETDVEIVAPEMDRLGALAIRRLGEQSTLVISYAPMALHERAAKRLFDLAISVPALIISLPVFAIVAIGIKIDSPGPVLFRQPRVGRGNRVFQVIKFRTMRSDNLDVAGKRSTGRNDHRITRFGGFLRRSSLDELPQLFNVVRGEMSIVGPRPHALGSTVGDELFWIADQDYWNRHSVKPGITGLAQIRGFRGTTEAKTDLTNRVRADLEYIANWSLWNDAQILLRTAAVVFHRNAY